jgi:hypothetical protein
MEQSTRQNVMSMEQERLIQRSTALNGQDSRQRVRVSKPYSSEDMGRKEMGNYQNMEGETEKINKYEVLNRHIVMTLIPILEIN